MSIIAGWALVASFNKLRMSRGARAHVCTVELGHVAEV
jgi:hypothetical protein